MDTKENYSILSYNLTKKIDKTEKKKNGIYFTPYTTINKTLNFLKPYMGNIKEVLEPSCGSCEYILNLKSDNIHITGIEKNEIIFESIKDLQTDNIKLYCSDYLTHVFNRKFDLIIGNPPYFTIKKDKVCKEYFNYFSGRPNIFILFIIKSLTLLNPNGILSFILPKNFLNCVYYDKTRKHINNNYKILTILNCNDTYIETKQETVLMIVQNNLDIHNNVLYSLNINSFTIFGLPENIVKLNNLTKNSTTLYNLGFDVNVGTIVWNQNKSKLTCDKKTLLIYSSDITDNKLAVRKYKDDSKKNYIDEPGLNVPLLVLNRGYGVGKYKFNYCLLDLDFEYLIENHLISIKYKGEIQHDQLIEKYNSIIKSFENKKTQDFIKLYFGNNAINTIELCNILPIYDI